MTKLALALVAACGGSPPPKPAPPPAPPPVVAPVATPEAPKPKSLIPDTPAGRTLGVMLDAFNKGDDAGLHDFAKRYEWPEPDDIVGFRTRSTRSVRSSTSTTSFPSSRRR
jgi:hypothetical protein